MNKFIYIPVFLASLVTMSAWADILYELPRPSSCVAQVVIARGDDSMGIFRALQFEGIGGLLGRREARNKLLTCVQQAWDNRWLMVDTLSSNYRTVIPACFELSSMINLLGLSHTNEIVLKERIARIGCKRWGDDIRRYGSVDLRVELTTWGEKGCGIDDKPSSTQTLSDGYTLDSYMCSVGH